VNLYATSTRLRTNAGAVLPLFNSGSLCGAVQVNPAGGVPKVSQLALSVVVPGLTSTPPAAEGEHTWSAA